MTAPPTPAETRVGGTDVQAERTSAGEALDACQEFLVGAVRAAERGTPLIIAALAAPLTAISRRWPTVLHAAEMETIISAWPNGTVTAACGKARLRLLAWGADRTMVPWPPRVDSLPADWTRCRDCHMATGRKRPRSRWVAVDAQ